MRIPKELKHKPVIVVEDYDRVDGRSAYDSDAKGLSLGLAQWNDRGRVDISGKIWRYTGEKWSRQSEEMPLHRVLDLTMLILRSKQYLMDEAYRIPGMFNRENPEIGRIGLQGDAMTVAVAADNPRINEDIKLFSDAFSRDDELLSERLHLLANTLVEMGYGRRRGND